MTDGVEECSTKFEESYRRVSTPRPEVRHNLTEKAIHESVESGNLFALIQNLAKLNDTTSLRMFLKEPFIGMAKSAFADVNDPESSLTYCVAPMLIDNSGNEAFAEEWMEAYGHTRDRAVDHMLKLWMQPMVGLQVEKARLGLATIADIFELREKPYESSTTPFQLAMGRDPSSPVTNAIKAMEFGHFLRICHPNKLPTVEMKNQQGEIVDVPLGDYLLAIDNVKSQHLLPALIGAYGPNSPMLRHAMRDSLNSMLCSKMLTTKPRNDGDIQWEAMRLWGDAEIGTSAWNTMTKLNRTFIESLVIGSVDVAIKRLNQLEALGVNIQAHCNRIDPIHNTPMRLLDMAVYKRNAELVGHLLGRGFDPELESINRKTQRFFSAATLALQCEPTDPAEPMPEALEQIQSLIRANLAKKQALQVIDELCMDVKTIQP